VVLEERSCAPFMIALRKRCLVSSIGNQRTKSHLERFLPMMYDLCMCSQVLGSPKPFVAA
jgi:hypothetical protein